MANSKIKIEVDTTELDLAIEKAKLLNSLLEKLGDQTVNLEIQTSSIPSMDIDKLLTSLVSVIQKTTVE